MKRSCKPFVESRSLLMLIGLLALAACAPPAPATPRPTAPVILAITVAPTQNVDATATAYARRLIPTPTPAGLYVVQQGDTLSSLAEDFGTTVEELMAANGLTDPNAIKAGQTLLIPSLITGTVPLATPVLTATASLTPTALVGQTSVPARRTATPTAKLSSP
jgi:LysM repeat protein